MRRCVGELARISSFYQNGVIVICHPAPRFSVVCGCIGVVALVAAGCDRSGPETAEVSGRVTLDGQPLTTGLVVFVSARVPPLAARLAPTARSAWARTGRPRVMGWLSAATRSSLAPDPKALAAIERSGVAPGSIPVIPSLVPERYTSPATSGLTCEVKAGQDNVLTLKLSRSPK